MSKGIFEVQIVLSYRYCMLVKADVISMHLREESLQRSLKDTVQAATTY